MMMKSMTTPTNLPTKRGIALIGKRVDALWRDVKHTKRQIKCINEITRRGMIMGMWIDFGLVLIASSLCLGGENKIKIGIQIVLGVLLLINNFCVFAVSRQARQLPDADELPNPHDIDDIVNHIGFNTDTECVFRLRRDGRIVRQLGKQVGDLIAYGIYNGQGDKMVKIVNRHAELPVVSEMAYKRWRLYCDTPLERGREMRIYQATFLRQADKLIADLYQTDKPFLQFDLIKDKMTWNFDELDVFLKKAITNDDQQRSIETTKAKYERR